MTTLRQIELYCPVCRHSFHSQAVVSTNAFGGKRTDFHECAAGTQPLAYLIHMCDECGYSGGERDFSGVTEVSPLVREHVLNELAARAPSSAFGSTKYEAAAKVARIAGSRTASDRGSAAPAAGADPVSTAPPARGHPRSQARRSAS